jgi:glycosyltransferase involved in cell wall biosynthesis
MRFALTRREALDTPDGINIFLFSLAEALLERGHEVVVVSSARTDRDLLREYYSLARWPDIVSLGMHQSVQYPHSLSAWLTKGRSVLRSMDPDLVIVNGAVPLRLDALTCTVSHDAEKRLGRFPFLRTAYKRFCYAKCDVVVATCEEVRAALSVDLRMQPAQIKVIPTCVKLSSYIQRPLRERENAILHMGTVDYKNPASSIKAFAAMASIDKKLYLTGRPTDEIKDLIQSLPSGTRGRIELLGYVAAPKLIELLGTVKVVSVPSIYAVPVASPTVIEALASGTPVVGSPSISREVLSDGVNGFVRAPADHLSMARAYEALLNDEQLWSRMAVEAVISSKLFSAYRVADLYLGLIGADRSGAMQPSEVANARIASSG